ADDVVIWSKNLEETQRALNMLERWSASRGLSINVAKTKAMKFRRGGRLARADKLNLSSKPIEFVNEFAYLGVRLQYTGNSFKGHIEDRTRSAMAVLAGIK